MVDTQAKASIKIRVELGGFPFGEKEYKAMSFDLQSLFQQCIIEAMDKQSDNLPVTLGLDFDCEVKVPAEPQTLQ